MNNHVTVRALCSSWPLCHSYGRLHPDKGYSLYPCERTDTANTGQQPAALCVVTDNRCCTR